MTSHELYDLLKKCGWETDPESVFHKIWGESFDGLTEKITEKITERDTERDTKRDTESLTSSALPLYICKTCDHEWDSDKWYCVACNTPYRIPNPARNNEPNRLSCPTQPNQ